jgi:hypothetical protein
MEKLNNKFAKTMVIEAKYSMVAKQFPIDLDKEELKKLNFDTFKVAKKIKIENLKVANEKELEY